MDKKLEEKILIDKQTLQDIMNCNSEILELLKSKDNMNIDKYKNINDKLEDIIRKESCINRFGEIFEIKNIKIDIEELPLLKFILREFGEDLYTPSKANEELRKEKIKLGNELEKTFTFEQKNKFIKYWELENQIAEELEGQLFMYGVIMAQELKNEVENTKTDKLLDQ